MSYANVIKIYKIRKRLRNFILVLFLFCIIMLNEKAGTTI